MMRNNERLLVRAPELARLLSVSTSMIYSDARKAPRDRLFPVHKVGRASLYDPQECAAKIKGEAPRIPPFGGIAD